MKDFVEYIIAIIVVLGSNPQAAPLLRFFVIWAGLLIRFFTRVLVTGLSRLFIRRGAKPAAKRRGRGGARSSLQPQHWATRRSERKKALRKRRSPQVKAAGGRRSGSAPPKPQPQRAKPTRQRHTGSTRSPRSKPGSPPKCPRCAKPVSRSRSRPALPRTSKPKTRGRSRPTRKPSRSPSGDEP